MAYTTFNFKTKKALKEAIAAGEKVTAYNPGLGGTLDKNCSVVLEGPHYPQPHKWYATATIVDGFITNVK